MRTCSVEGCDSKHYGKGMCHTHWRKEYSQTPEAKRLKAEQDKKYFSKNKEKIRVKYKKRKSEYYKKYRIINAEKIASRQKIWWEENPEYQTEWRDKNRHLHNAKELRRRARKANNGVFEIRPSEMFRLYNSPCINCGSVDNIQADHIIPISKGGRHSVGNLQPLCSKCNISKGSKFMFQWKQSLKGSGSNK